MVTYTYNNRMRASLTLQQPTGNWTNGYTWDAAHRLSTETSPAGAFTYTYSGAGKLVKKLALPNASYITNTYDNVARLTGTYLDNSVNTILDKSEYLYNSGNQRIRHTRTDGSYYTNNYDNIGQLTWAESTVANEDRGYLYDAAWNLNVRTNNGITKPFIVDGLNQVTNVGGTTHKYDGNGNLTNSTSLSYSYDDENRLISAESASNWRTEWVYDGRSRLRVRKEYGWSGSFVLTNEVHYVYDGMRVIQERNSANTPTVSYTRGSDLSAQAPFLGGAGGGLEGAGGIGGLLARSHGYSSGSWTGHNFYHADGNGNITMLIDNAGTPNVTASYRYDPFGNSISATGTNAVNNVYRFSSKEQHANSGMYYYGYRFYDPNLQRWLNRDPIQELGGINLYAYVLNRPAEMIDAIGLDAQSAAAYKCLARATAAYMGAVGLANYLSNRAAIQDGKRTLKNGECGYYYTLTTVTAGIFFGTKDMYLEVCKDRWGNVGTRLVYWPDSKTA